MLSQMSTMRMLYLGSIKPLNTFTRKTGQSRTIKWAVPFFFRSLLHLRGAGMI